MSTTAVPIAPVRRGTLVKLWIGVGCLLLVAASLACVGTGDIRLAALPAADYMAANLGKSGVKATADGLQYKILRAGEGGKPTASDVVVVHYVGKLTDGTIFDSSYTRGQPVPMPVTGVIPGMAEGLQLMQKGGKYRLWIPPELGYGPQGAGEGVIPGNAVLVFDVELLEVVPRSAAMEGMMPPAGNQP